MEGILRRLFKGNSFGLAKKAEAELTEQKREDILNQIKDVKIKLSAIRSCFDLETDFDMIECYISEMDALEKRYAFLLKKAKQERITAYILA